MRVHQANPLDASYVIPVFLIQQVEVFFAQPDG